MKLLLGKGANIEARDNNGHTALLWASFQGHTDVVRQLLDKGTNVDARNNDGYTPLLWAALADQDELRNQRLNASGIFVVEDPSDYMAYARWLRVT